MVKLHISQPAKSNEEQSIDRQMITESIKILKKLADEVVQVQVNVKQIKELLEFNFEEIRSAQEPDDWHGQGPEDITEDELYESYEDTTPKNWDGYE